MSFNLRKYYQRDSQYSDVIICQGKYFNNNLNNTGLHSITTSLDSIRDSCNDVCIRKKGLTSDDGRTMTYPVRGTSSFFQFRGNRCSEITHSEISVTSIFAATKMPLYVLATTSCTPPIREVTTDTSLVQVVTPPDGAGDVLYAVRYEPDKLWVQCSQAPPSDAERTQLNRARKDVVTNSDGVYTTCPEDFTSELRALYPSAAHIATSQWHDARVELKALKKRVPLLEKAKYNFKPLENAVDGLECTHRLREETRGMSGLPFHANHVEALRSQLPALIAVGDADKRKAVLKRLIDMGLTDEISRANADPYKGSKKTANRALIKQYKTRIDLLERFYTPFADERNLPSEEQIRLRNLVCSDNAQNPWKAVEAKCMTHGKLREPMKSVTPEQMHTVSQSRIGALYSAFSLRRV